MRTPHVLVFIGMLFAAHGCDGDTSKPRHSSDKESLSEGSRVPDSAETATPYTVVPSRVTGTCPGTPTVDVDFEVDALVLNVVIGDTREDFGLTLMRCPYEVFQPDEVASTTYQTRVRVNCDYYEEMGYGTADTYQITYLEIQGE